MAPSTACPSTSGTAAVAGHRSRRTARKSTQARIAVANTRTDDTTTMRRWENSISECMVPDGKSSPGKQVGQLEQPSPDPLPRTRPPTANSTIVATAVIAESLRKRESRSKAPR